MDFVDNLPYFMSKAWLWKIFKFDGQIVDIDISRKVRKITTQPFAFMRYGSKDHNSSEKSRWSRGERLLDKQHGLEGGDPKSLLGGLGEKPDDVVGRSYKDVLKSGTKNNEETKEKGADFNFNLDKRKYVKSKVLDAREAQHRWKEVFLGSQTGLWILVWCQKRFSGNGSMLQVSELWGPSNA